jgi:hypothetical protein
MVNEKNNILGLVVLVISCVNKNKTVSYSSRNKVCLLLNGDGSHEYFE